MNVAIVGAGWAGATAARVLVEAGVGVEVFEATSVVGGHSRVERIDGIVYEPNGAHIFHTSDAEVAAFVQRFGMSRPYQHRVVTEVYPDPEADEPLLMSWPPQIEEIDRLPQASSIRRELDELPDRPHGEDFETWVISLMGETLYRLMVENYTRKQWGLEPSELSSSFAPKRVDFRTDGNRRLFRDRWEFFEAEGVNSVIESVLGDVAVRYDTEVGLADLDDLSAAFDHVVVTAPLDRFVGRDGDLAWRGVLLDSVVIPTATLDGTATPAYVVNRPSMRVPYTRTIETKHASGQRVQGTVVSYEMPGHPARHYPVPTVDQHYEQLNERLKMQVIEAAARPVSFCGRLANYQYINQDEAIRQGFDCAQAILRGART